MTHKLNSGGFAQGHMAIPPHGSDAERHGLFAIDMAKLLTSIRDTELGTFSHHQSLLDSNLATISSKSNDTRNLVCRQRFTLPPATSVCTSGP